MLNLVKLQIGFVTVYQVLIVYYLSEFFGFANLHIPEWTIYTISPYYIAFIILSLIMQS